MKTPEQNEATLHRAVEQAQRERWEKEDPEDEDEDEKRFCLLCKREMTEAEDCGGDCVTCIEEIEAEMQSDSEDLPDEVECAYCECDMGRGAGYKTYDGRLCCSRSCACEYDYKNEEDSRE